MTTFDHPGLLYRSPGVFIGYYKNEEATAETIEGAWLHTGDLGRLDDDGFLHVTGRKKDHLITAGGKNVAPADIEAALKRHPMIGEAVLIGDRRRFLTVLVTLDEARYARPTDAGPPPHEDDAIRDEVQRAIDRINHGVAQPLAIKRFVVLPRAFTVDRGELTPTLKVRRAVVERNFAPQIEAMYR